jgi:hypothetical protein
MSSDDQYWDEKDIIPSSITYKELFFELLRRTRRNTIKIGYVIQLSENLASNERVDQQSLISLMAEGDKNVKDLLAFVKKLDAYIQTKQEEYINSSKS